MIKNKCLDGNYPYGKKGNVYIGCTKPKEECFNVNVSEKELISQLEDVFKNLVIPE